MADDGTVIVRDESTGTMTTHGGSPRKGSKETLDEEEQREAARFYTYAFVFFAAIAVMLYQAPPGPANGTCDNVSLVWLVKGVASGNLLGTLQEAWRCAEAYNGAHPQYTLGIICSVYIGLQTFAIPGPRCPRPPPLQSLRSLRRRRVLTLNRLLSFFLFNSIGPLVLSIVGGALYGFWGGQLLNAVCAGIGASACFMLSKTMGR